MAALLRLAGDGDGRVKIQMNNLFTVWLQPRFQKLVRHGPILRKFIVEWGKQPFETILEQCGK